jgi:hypothetical protein
LSHRLAGAPGTKSGMLALAIDFPELLAFIDPGHGC